MSIKTPDLLHRLNYKTIALAIVCSTAFTSCQSTETQQEEAPVATERATAADTTQRRPAPEFYIIPKGMERKRVWVCDDNVSDIFHVDNTCEILRTCTGTFRNVSLQRAIEEYGRYNCTVCASELADIFDENKIR
ncbi:hypothetical protein [Pontibacter pudoricolor]|uniref:hypothetical protein n=1 Tax=Pontibacter pudoricolor TaxID=2694930 RepID=UPI00139145E0|nr:hypothetical protein [Pontibacter pudoricolor]